MYIFFSFRHSYGENVHYSALHNVETMLLSVAELVFNQNYK